MGWTIRADQDSPVALWWQPIECDVVVTHSDRIGGGPRNSRTTRLFYVMDTMDNPAISHRYNGLSFCYIAKTRPWVKSLFFNSLLNLLRR